MLGLLMLCLTSLLTSRDDFADVFTLIRFGRTGKKREISNFNLRERIIVDAHEIIITLIIFKGRLSVRVMGCRA